ncbi:MAG: mycofactocin system transcriptional regulator [Actinobacteria bacterium]|nr:mycofactocin system transcriptional regulator [Actinomycetota bacterium]
MSIGRPPTTNHAQIEKIALALFEERGFEETTVDDIAAAVGVGRRTIFRYFASKNDIVWGEFDRVIARLREAFDAEPEDAPLTEALRRAVVASNHYEPDQLPELRIRMTLITTAPALQAHSMLRYAAWRNAVAEMVAPRLGARPEDLAPQALGHAALGASMAAFDRWVSNPGEDLGQCLEEAYRLLASGFDPDAV